MYLKIGRAVGLRRKEGGGGGWGSGGLVGVGSSSKSAYGEEGNRQASSKPASSELIATLSVRRKAGQAWKRVTTGYPFVAVMGYTIDSVEAGGLWRNGL